MTPSQTAHPTEGEIAQTPVERTEPGPFSQLVDREWLDLCEKSDRTSDHPDMCLITRVELAGAMSEAFFAGTDAARSTQPSRPQGEEGLREAEKAATEANRDLRSALWQTLYPKFFLNKKALAEALDVMLPVFNAYATAQAVHAVFGRAALSNQGKPSS